MTSDEPRPFDPQDQPPSPEQEPLEKETAPQEAPEDSAPKIADAAGREVGDALAPEVEDVLTSPDSAAEVEIEDDPALLDPAVRSLEAAEEVAGESDEKAGEAPAAPVEAVAQADDTSDTARVPDELPATSQKVEDPALVDWTNELSVYKIAVELKRVEAEVRSLLEGRDVKRKRKLAGTYRWLELEGDIVALRFTGRLEEAVLDRLGRLVRRRHYLFRRLRFLTDTRPTWNT